MAHQKTSRHSDKTGCPLAFGLDIFGDRWTLLVLRDLLIKGKRHYGEFLASDEGISTNILADRLMKLEAEGLVERHRDNTRKNRVIYQPTEKGRDLLPSLLELVRWGGKYYPECSAPQAVLERIETDRDGFVADILRNLDICEDGE